MWKSFALFGLLALNLKVTGADLEPSAAADRRFPDVDQRQSAAAVATRPARPADPARDIAERSLAQRVPQLQIKRDALHDSPRWIMARDGFLSGPDGTGRGISAPFRQAQRNDDPHRAVKAFINEHATLFGHTATALDQARLLRHATAPRSGLRTAVWQQELEGIPICDASFVAHTARAGELVSIASFFLRDPARANRPRAVAPMAVEEALAIAALNIGEQGVQAKEFLAQGNPAGAMRRQKFQGPALRGEAMAQLTWLPWDADTLRLAWEIWLSGNTEGNGYQILIDAASGETLRRLSQTVDASNASFRVFTSDSPKPFSPGLNAPGDSAAIASASRSLQTLISLNATASPAGWVADGTNTLRGNNAFCYRINWTPNDSGHSGVSDTVLGNPFRVFDRPFNPLLSPPDDLYVEGANDRAAMVNLFYWCNWMHDKLYALGFTETAGNYQDSNFGRGGEEGDRLTLEAQDVSNANNASFTPAPDGTSGRISMGRWIGSGGRRDSAFDAEVILHEYAHGLSHRLVGDGNNALGTSQSRGLGEGWSDFYALSLLSQSADALGGNYAASAYATGAFYRNGGGWGFDGQFDHYYFGIRRYPYSTNMTKNPLTLKDIDPTKADRHLNVPTSPLWFGARAEEVHNQGEVWCATLWDARAQLIRRDGFSAGNQGMLELVTEGLKLTPDAPGFLEARDAVLAADQSLNGGANRALLWAAFARRGMGWQASVPASSNNVGVVENFDVPDDFIVQPATGFTIRGPVGGPFSASSKSYSLTHLVLPSTPWSARADAPLQVSASSGTLNTAGQMQTVTVSLNAQLAAQLPSGIYNLTVTFSNRNSGVVVRRPFRLLVGVDFYTEEFKDASGERFDMANRSLTFTRDASDGSYSLCQNSALNFPIDPAGGQFLSEDEDCHLVTLGPGRIIQHYDGLYSAVMIHKQGSVILGDVCGVFNSLSAHFAYPHVSPFMRTQYPIASNAVSWLELGDRLVVTWDGMRTYDPPGTNAYQAELFYNGNVRMTWRKMTTPNAVVGLSRGTEQPIDFTPLNLSEAFQCADKLSLLIPTEATEGSGPLVAAGHLSLPLPRSSPLQVSLFSSYPSKVNVPAAVTIPTGASSVSFDVTPTDNALLDGSQSAVITASAGGFIDVHKSILVHDNESAQLSINAATTITEGGVLAGTVSVPQAVDDDVVVRLSSNRPLEIGFFSILAFIPKGQSQGDFLLAAFEDQSIQGPRTATLSATVSNWISGTLNLTVLDNEKTNLFVRGIDQLSEGSGIVPNGGRVYLSGTVPSNVVVTLFTSDLTELRVPPSVVIPAGMTNAYFDLTYVDDDLLGENPLVTINASAPGFGGQFDVVFVLDNDGPVEPFDPQPPDQSVNVPRDTNLAWGKSDGDLIHNGSFNNGLEAWTREDVGAGGWAINDGTFVPESGDGPLPPLDTSGPSVLSHQSGNGRHALYQDFQVPLNATTVTLSWWDRIRNHANAFSGDHQFRVELRNPVNNATLAVLFQTAPGDPLFSDWRAREVSLNAWRGQPVRLAFVAVDGLGYLHTHLDDIRVMAVGPVSTLYDVYFGTTNEPGAAQYLGSTTQSQWPLPPLFPETTYYWKILAHRDSILSVGPVWQFTTAGQSNQLVLISSNAIWRYVANGVYPGSTWTESSYDDRTWPQAAAKLGYGGDGENTIIGSSANNYITYWFRRRFTVTDPSRLLSLTARLIRDDGAAVYLNDVMVWSDNLPRPFDQATPASSILNAPEEREWIESSLAISRLNPGQNLLAVEVHQRHGTFGNSPDLGFAFELVGDVDAANPPPTISWTQPAPFAVIHGPINVALGVNATDLDGNGAASAVSKVEYFANGTKFGQNLAAPFNFTWPSVALGEYALHAVATDAGGLRATTDVRYITVAASSPLLTLLPRGSVWRYSDADIDLGTNWISPRFSDRDWAHGPAQLGFGDGDEATFLHSGLDPFFKPITTYFRQDFENMANLASYTLRVVRDDGVIVYVDGREVFRNNLPAGAVTHATLASSDLSGTAENAFITATINLSLSPGSHAIAAEVHQSSPASSDLSFDLELIGVGNPLPQAEIVSPASGLRILTPTILLLAVASDPFGEVASVQFLDNGVALGTSTTPPYQWTWLNPTAGQHTLTAIATDVQGASQTSSPVIVTLLLPVSLTVRVQGTKALLTWPVTIEGYRLESTTNLNPQATWMPVPNPMTHVNGQFQVTVDITEVRRFFRLVAP